MTDSRIGIAILPLQLRREIEGDMEKILREAAESMKAYHAFICFIQEEDRESEANLFQFSNSLWLGKESMTLHVLNIRKGLSGLAVNLNDVVVYPSNPETNEHYVETDERVCSEIAGPIRYRGDVTGVIVLDRVHNEDNSLVFNNDDKRQLRGYIEKLEALIREVEPATDDTRTAEALQKDANEIVGRIAKALRGFIAIKGPYGRIRYYKAGDNIEGFHHLSLEEGLAGKVFQTGCHINCGDVLGDPDYIASDPRIRSELIEPIKVEGKTVGIINLESDEPNAFAATDVYVLESWAQKVSDRIRRYRNSAGGDFIYAPGDLAAKIARVRSRNPDEEVESGILLALAETVESTFKPVCHGFFYRASAEPKDLPDWVARELERKEMLQETVVYSQGQQRFVIAPVFADEGVLLDLLWFEIGSETDQHDLRGKMDQLCLAASTALKDWKREYRLKQHLSLTLGLVARPPGIDILQQVVRTVPAIVESDFCTLFHRVIFRNSPFFVPTVSSAPTRLVTGHPEDHPWYEPCIEDGLTACVMVTGQPLVIQDVDNREELQGISRKLGIQEPLQWRRHMSEERSTTCRSFMSYPILHPERNGEVIGVIRTHRSQENRRSRFTTEDERCMQEISSLIAPILVNFCDR